MIGNAMRCALPRSTPEAQGISSGAILNFLDALEAQGHEFHSLMLLRHGQVVAEGWWSPYSPNQVQLLYSLSKSFAATAVGLAIAEGLFGLDDRVIAFFPEQAPKKPGPNLEAMTVRHLLTMTTGQETEPWEGGSDWAKNFLAAPVEHEPGSRFSYNTLATYMAGLIVQKRTGQSLLDYLAPRLLGPLGLGQARWENCPLGHNVGGFGLSLCTEDIARFGQLYLQKGQWQGQQLLPQGWVEAATAKQVENSSENPDWSQGYGFQFWRCQHGAYRADGAFGQFCMVMPDQDAVLVITSRTQMQAVLDLVWAHLLPAMGKTVLPERADAQRLRLRLSQLSFAFPANTVAPAFVRRAFNFAENDLGISRLELEPTPTGGVLRVEGKWGQHQVNWKVGGWEFGSTELFKSNHDPLPWKVAAAGGWTVEGLRLQLCFYETPFAYKLDFRFEGKGVGLKVDGNIGFGPTEHPLLQGEADD
jgi:CubicO group peptidase (beta-lactamase class C family)